MRKNTQHGMSRSPTYKSWQMMKVRCYNTNYNQYKDYGGRGITVCDSWLEGFTNFLADMGERPNGTTLERIDVNLPYSASNCRWATRAEQMANRRTHELTGVRKVGNRWQARVGMNYRTVHLGYFDSQEEAIKASQEARV